MSDHTDEKQDAPQASKKWLDMIQDAEKAFRVYQEKCDNIDKLYANLKSMSETVGDREFQIFWANMEVLRPTIYQRAPRPVVMPRHSDLGESVRKAAEMLERALSMDVEQDDVHDTLIQVRDDLAISGRGVAWVLDNSSCIHVDRCDFVHDPARKWSEVGWVARRAYLTREDGLERFGDIFWDAKLEKMSKDREDDYHPEQKKAQVWELWSKTENIVVWVTEGVGTVLDASEPMFDVKGFFPCPKPAYASLERRTLKPVPDFVYYRDQVDEINELTARISGLAESLRLKGFYASGVSEVGEAIETAMRQTDNTAILVPVSNFAALGGTALKDAVIWLPVREVAEVITNLVALRQQLIQDVYEITGLSDIMRGSTDADETAKAQTLKAQYGSVRVRERQNEMVRVALDVLRIKAEIFAEQFDVMELMTMAGMSLPTMAQLQQEQAMAQQQGKKPPKGASIEEVSQLLKSERIRPFLMEVESDSTIMPDEEAEKQSRIEFTTAIGQFLTQAGPMVQAEPSTAPFIGELLKFTAGGFRAGRDLGGAIDDFVDQLEARVQQPQPPNPEVIKAQAEAQAKQADLQDKERDRQLKASQEDKRLQADIMLRREDSAQKAQEASERLSWEREKHAQDYQLKLTELGLSDTPDGAVDPRTEGLKDIMIGLQAMMATLSQQLAESNMPKRIVRDGQGEIVGVEPVPLN